MPECYEPFNTQFVNEWAIDNGYKVDHNILSKIKFCTEIYEYSFKCMPQKLKDLEILYIKNPGIFKNQKFTYIIERALKGSQTYEFANKYFNGDVFAYAIFADNYYITLLQEKNKEIEELKAKIATLTTENSVLKSQIVTLENHLME